jgi:hypothetical protein
MKGVAEQTVIDEKIRKLFRMKKPGRKVRVKVLTRRPECRYWRYVSIRT